MIQKKYLEVIKKIGVIGKDAENPFAKSKYASLTNILNKVQPLLNDKGLILKFDFPALENDAYTIKATLQDVEEEVNSINSIMTWDFVIPHDQTQKNKTQGFGSTMTYGQRYMYAIIFQIPFDDQDPDAKPKNKQEADNKGAPDKDDGKPWLNGDTPEWTKAKQYMKEGGNVEEIRKKYKVSKKLAEKLVKCGQDGLDDVDRGTPQKAADVGTEG